MFKSRLQRIGAFLLNAALAAGVFTIAVQPASAQVQVSPGARQMLVAILRGLPPQAQQMVINALQTIGPQRAEEWLAKARRTPPDVRQAYRSMVVTALQGLPRQYHQAFINGFFGVSPGEAQWAGQVMNQVGQTIVGNNARNAYTANIAQIIKRQTDEGYMFSLGPNTWPYGSPYGWYPRYHPY